MANSRKWLSTEDSVRDEVQRAVSRLLHPDGVTKFHIAFSGGLDSTVLLDAAVTASRDWIATGRIVLSAVHVNHGISPNAEDWASHCERVCRRFGVELSVFKVDLPATGASLEDLARQARYRIFEHLETDYVLLAQHADDQAETLLMNLARGAGLLGAAAIPVRRGRFVRPLLACTREQIRAYAEARGLEWVEDESNAATRFSRNHLRHVVLPRIREKFPAANRHFASAAGQFAETLALLDQLALLDGLDADAALPVALLAELQQKHGRSRMINLLASYLRAKSVRIPSRAWIEESARQLLAAGVDRQVCIAAGRHRIRRFRGEVHVVVEEGETAVPDRCPWAGAGMMVWGGAKLAASATRGRGLAQAKLRGVMELRRRFGGETMELRSGNRRPVKDLLREAGIPPWRRSRLPLLFLGEELIWIPGVGIAEKYLCNAQEDGISLEFDGPNW